MSDDLIERLCAAGWCRIDSAGKRWVDDAPMDAVRAIVEKDAEIERLRDALKPFAQEHAWGPDDRFEIVIAGQYGGITGADLDRARAALTLPPKA